MSYEAGKAAYDRDDFSTALREWSSAAEAGDAEARNGMGLLFLRGKGVPKNEAEAARWFALAADHGLDKACLNLGLAYRDGKGVSQDSSRAVALITQAAEHGLAAAQFSLGLMYKQGNGVKQDYAAGVAWSLKAAEQGHSGAQFNLGLWFQIGEVVERNVDESLRWFHAAAEQGNLRALESLGDIYFDGDGVDVDLAEAARWYGKLAEKGDAYGQYRMGCAFLRGTGVERDQQRAFEWLNKAAEQEHADALYELAQTILDGNGTQYSLPGYFQLVSRAVDKGCEQAVYPHHTTQWVVEPSAAAGRFRNPTRSRLNDFVCQQDDRVVHGHDPLSEEFGASRSPLRNTIKANPPLLAYAMAAFDGDEGRFGGAFQRSKGLFDEGDLNPEQGITRGDSRAARARQALDVCEFNDTAAYVLTVYYKDAEENWERCLDAATRFLSVRPGNKHARFIAGAAATQLEWWPEAVDLLDPVVTGGMLGMGPPEVVYDSSRYFIWSLVYWLRSHFDSSPSGLVGARYDGRLSPFERLQSALITFGSYARLTAGSDAEQRKDADHKARMISAIRELEERAKREGRIGE